MHLQTHWWTYVAYIIVIPHFTVQKGKECKFKSSTLGYCSLDLFKGSEQICSAPLWLPSIHAHTCLRGEGQSQDGRKWDGNWNKQDVLSYLYELLQAGESLALSRIEPSPEWKPGLCLLKEWTERNRSLVSSLWSWSPFPSSAPASVHVMEMELGPADGRVDHQG